MNKRLSRFRVGLCRRHNALLYKGGVLHVNEGNENLSPSAPIEGAFGGVPASSETGMGLQMAVCESAVNIMTE
jgi:hypothetical protein